VWTRRTPISAARIFPPSKISPKNQLRQAQGDALTKLPEDVHAPENRPKKGRTAARWFSGTGLPEKPRAG
jgi:hypothetical protein